MKRLLNANHAAKFAQHLRWASSQSTKTAVKSDVSTQIASPALCDDILQRLAPSLQAHHGSDLIDINPGTCLWSRHLHDALKPRRHILVEPDRKAFDEFITPLIEQDPKRFVHAETLAEALASSNGFLSEDVIKSGAGEPRTAINMRLLMTVNTTRPIDPLVVDGSAPGYFVNDYYTSFRGLRNDIHRYGLVRVLAWVSEAHTSMAIPRTVGQRTRQSLLLEATSSSSEVAGAGWRRASSQFDHEFNWPDLVLEAADTVRNIEVAQGIEMPATRRDLPPLPPSWSLSPDLELLRTIPHSSHIIKQREILELLELDNQLQIEDPQWRMKALSAKGRMHRAKNPEQSRWRELRQIRLLDYKRYLDTVSLVSKQRNLERRWRDDIRLGGGALSSQDGDRFEEEAARLKTAINEIKRPFLPIIKKAIDEYRAYDSQPQALAWNTRRFEPLTVHPHEFAPQQPLSLIDIVPSPEFRQRLDTEDQCEIFDYVVRTIWKQRPNSSLYDGLTALLTAGVEEFVKTCPSLKDPGQGGWYDLTELRIRSLPVKSYLDIALAWKRWPFRPPLSQTLPVRNKSLSKFRDLDEFTGV